METARSMDYQDVTVGNDAHARMMAARAALPEHGGRR